MSPIEGSVYGIIWELPPLKLALRTRTSRKGAHEHEAASDCLPAPPSVAEPPPTIPRHGRVVLLSGFLRQDDQGELVLVVPATVCRDAFKAVGFGGFNANFRRR
jgi:hypothetical protein